MSTHRLALTGVALFAASGLILTGCHDDSSTASPAATVSGSSNPSSAAAGAATGAGTTAAAKDAVVAAITGLKTTSYAYAVKQQDINGQGVADPVNHAASANLKGTQSVSATVAVLLLGTDSWARIDAGKTLNAQGGIDPTTWYHLDTSKIKAGGTFIDPSNADLLDFSTVAPAIVDVRRTDATHYAGTLDLSKIQGVLASNLGTLDSTATKAAQALPFTATLDSQGRLTDFSINAAGVDPSATATVTFSDYGAAQHLSKPSGTIVEAPSVLYDFFNG